MPVTSREWQLAARPTGEPRDSDVAFTEATVPDPAPGQVLVRNDWLSVDPYMRGRMNEGESYIPPFELGETMTGSAVGTVVASGSDGVPVGTTVNHFQGWREYALLDAEGLQTVDTDLAPAQAYLGVLGTTGLTAYATLVEVSPVREGDVVFVSGAAGAVGSVAGQIARHLGAAKVIGSAGGPEKARRLVEDFGFDTAIDYREGDLPGQLAEAAPEGIDVYLDNVGGDHLEAALGAMNLRGRVGLVGAISVYNATEAPAGPRTLPLAIGRRITLRGMNVADHFHLVPEFVGRAATWLADGSLRTEETVVDGIENAFDAFTSMMRGANTGKMLVRLTHE
ncbi:NADP-dependent oxidoreductase [Nocardiopsis sp. NRRL B-16309]|uniref:NADP-dependent oxidoreductase n=1 Tax=Nocardiopsis sp. NRRL B-16309 TaxID=1519494 RepID=UPI0006ADCCE9|nr:NADP-dependent oxidoreductase [Nocardiopsis sp. NRRL B-16309]KOX11894.1 NADP-dependent oxidoreductase [Nocardiopsis sp. NRRL B-16309]